MESGEFLSLFISLVLELLEVVAITIRWDLSWLLKRMKNMYVYDVVVILTPTNYSSIFHNVSLQEKSLSGPWCIV